MTDLRLADVIARPARDAIWELAIVFRAELTGAPGGDERRHPHPCAAGEYEGISGFGAVEIERWLGGGRGETPVPRGRALLF